MATLNTPQNNTAKQSLAPQTPKRILKGQTAGVI
jgi:hypothetical protein